MTELKYQVQIKCYNHLKTLSMSYGGKSQTSIEVLIRMQPPSSRHLRLVDDQTILCNSKQFNYDHIFPPETDQEEIFKKVGTKVLDNLLKGYNSCVFVYGQTGSGKTYTMTGTQNGTIPGLVQNSIDALWDLLLQFSEFEIKVSFMQIYNQDIFDLLNTSSQRDSIKIKIREDVKEGIYIQNLKVQSIVEKRSMFELLNAGLKNRHKGETKMNRQSSRSHSIFSLKVSYKHLNQETNVKSIITSKINFVDLAGSQKQKATETSGNRLKEAANINRSLSHLTTVISELSQKKQFISYRNSKLTLTLRDSLGGNAKTILIATLSSKQDAFLDTLSTLYFAEKAKKVKQKAKINEEVEGDSAQLKHIINALEAELFKLRDQLEDIQNQQIIEIECERCQSINIEMDSIKNIYEEQILSMQVHIQKLQNYMSQGSQCQSELPNTNYMEGQQASQQQVALELETIYEESQSGSKRRSSVVSCGRDSGDIQFKGKLENIELLHTELNQFKLQNQELRLQLRRIQESEEIYSPMIQLMEKHAKKIRFTEVQRLILQAQHKKLQIVQKQLEEQVKSWFNRQNNYKQQISLLKETIQKEGSKKHHMPRHNTQMARSQPGQNQMTNKAYLYECNSQLNSQEMKEVKVFDSKNKLKSTIEKLQRELEESKIIYQLLETRKDSEGNQKNTIIESLATQLDTVSETLKFKETKLAEKQDCINTTLNELNYIKTSYLQTMDLLLKSQNELQHKLNQQKKHYQDIIKEKELLLQQQLSEAKKSFEQINIDNNKCFQTLLQAKQKSFEKQIQINDLKIPQLIKQLETKFEIQIQTAEQQWEKKLKVEQTALNNMRVYVQRQKLDNKKLNYNIEKLQKELSELKERKKKDQDQMRKTYTEQVQTKIKRNDQQKQRSIKQIKISCQQKINKLVQKQKRAKKELGDAKQTFEEIQSKLQSDVKHKDQIMVTLKQKINSLQKELLRVSSNINITYESEARIVKSYEKEKKELRQQVAYYMKLYQQASSHQEILEDQSRQLKQITLEQKQKINSLQKNFSKSQTADTIREQNLINQIQILRRQMDIEIQRKNLLFQERDQIRQQLQDLKKKAVIINQKNIQKRPICDRLLVSEEDRFSFGDPNRDPRYENVEEILFLRCENQRLQNSIKDIYSSIFRILQEQQKDMSEVGIDNILIRLQKQLQNIIKTVQCNELLKQKNQILKKRNSLLLKEVIDSNSKNAQ